MSSPSSSSSATAGRLRWTRRRPPRRRALIEWSAAAVVAAALYLAPALLVGVLAGIGWTIAALVACLAVLVLYSFRFGSLLGVFMALVMVAGVELAVRFATFGADTCGSSRLATVLEWSGTSVLLLVIGSFGAYRRRVLPLLAALLAAGVWVVVIAHLVRGGAGDCFH
jgi:hypothetical protein